MKTCYTMQRELTVLENVTTFLLLTYNLQGYFKGGRGGLLPPLNDGLPPPRNYNKIIIEFHIHVLVCSYPSSNFFTRHLTPLE